MLTSDSDKSHLEVVPEDDETTSMITDNETGALMSTSGGLSSSSNAPISRAMKSSGSSSSRARKSVSYRHPYPERQHVDYPAGADGHRQSVGRRSSFMADMMSLLLRRSSQSAMSESSRGGASIYELQELVDDANMTDEEKKWGFWGF